jgi:general secretion pathway protein A
MSSTLLIYAEHFGLRDRAFSLLPDPEYLYWSSVHARAYSMLEYGLLTHAPITVITGEVGAGKTTLIRHLLRNIPDDFIVGLVSNAQGDRGQLLHWVLLALGQSADINMPYVHLFNLFQNFLISAYAAGQRTILIFDEAQNLTIEMLEELRMFSNINADKDELLQIVLVGQPQLREIINRPQLEQFSQRIASDFHLPAMTAEGVDRYILHRLEVAGAKKEIFTAEARKSIYNYSRGIPRLINKICETALVYAFSDNLSTIDEEFVEKVVADWKELGHFKFGHRKIKTPKPSPQKTKERIIELAGKGLSPREIRQYLSDHHSSDLYMREIAETVSIFQTDVREWLGSTLLPSYSVVCFDQVWIKVRNHGTVRSTPFYFALGQDEFGNGHVLTVKIGDIIGAKTYAAVMADLLSRGVKHISVASIEGADGYFDAVSKAFPATPVIRTFHRMIFLTRDHLPAEAYSQFVSEIAAVFSIENGSEAKRHFEIIAEKWCVKYPKMRNYWKEAEPSLSLLRGKNPATLAVVRAAPALQPLYRGLMSISKVRSPFRSVEAVIEKVRTALWKSLKVE